MIRLTFSGAGSEGAFSTVTGAAMDALIAAETKRQTTSAANLKKGIAERRIESPQPTCEPIISDFFSVLNR